MKHAACALTLTLTTLTALAQTEPAAAPAPTQETAADAPAQVVVEGRRPGPGVWKVSKGDHVLWVFGLYAPLPKKMEWDDARVERLVKQSQEVLMQPGSRIEVGFFRQLTLLPSMMSMEKMPDGATLQQVLPADVYVRWRVLKEKYIGTNADIERSRPMFASNALLEAALDKHGLTPPYRNVAPQIVKIAKRNKVKVTETTIVIEPAEQRRLLDAFKQSQLDDTACFKKTLDNLEGDIDAMRTRANAWADGAIGAIREADYVEREKACDDAILNSDFAKASPELKDMRERVRVRWLQVAETALATNASTFALLGMSTILDPHGYLADLQAKGYTVESPK